MEKGHHPYIMPDGRPLGQFLEQEHQQKGSRKNSSSTRREKKAERSAGWTHRSVYNMLDPAPSTNTAEGEERAAKLGKDRRRRYLNDKLLREMAGALSAADMESLFQPAPFGDTGYESPLTQVTSPDISPIWDLFRNINEDKQNKTLQAWEAHLKARQQQRRPDSQDEEECAPSMSGFQALRSWSGLPKKSRDALKRSSAGYIEELELPIMEYMDRRASGAEPEDAEYEASLENGHQRLLVHALASFHSLSSISLASGVVRIQGKGGKLRSSPGISCADIVFALSQNPVGGLNASTLNEQWRRMQYGTDGDSEASFVIV